MLILKYSKTGDAKYISHVDALRVLVRTFRRMGIAVEYSKGFNPHMLLNMSPPLPVGQESVTEFVEIATDAPIEGFAGLFNKNCPEGFAALSVWKTEKSPRITALTTQAEYTAQDKAPDGHAAAQSALVFTVPCGNKNLRADKYLLSIGIDPANKKITRTKLYAGEEKLILIDDLTAGS